MTMNRNRRKKISKKIENDNRLKTKQRQDEMQAYFIKKDKYFMNKKCKIEKKEKLRIQKQYIFRNRKREKRIKHVIE